MANLQCFEGHEPQLVAMDDPSERSLKEAKSLQKLFTRREEKRAGLDYAVSRLRSTQSELGSALNFIRQVEAKILHSMGCNELSLRDMTALANDMDSISIKEESVSSLNIKMGKMAITYEDLSTLVTIQLYDSEKVIAYFYFLVNS